jgi:hypothetical protein
MNETPNDEWSSWQQAWQTPAAPEATTSVLERVEHSLQRHRRAALAVTALDALTSVALGGLGLVVLRSGESLALRVWAISLLVFTASLMAFGIWNRRDALFFSARPAADFLVLWQLRLSRRERTPKVLAGFAALEVAFGLACLARWNPEGLPLALAAYAGIALVLTPGWFWYRARLRRERAQLDAWSAGAE